MSKLLVILDSITNGGEANSFELLDFIAFLSFYSGIMIVISNNPVVSVLFLIGLFLCVSCILIELGLSFIALAYLLVYVGAVSILILFIVMLINVRLSEIKIDSTKSFPLGLLIGIGTILLVWSITIKKEGLFNPTAYVTSSFWDGNYASTIDISTIGYILYSSYAAWLLITALILLLAMVGAIVITIKSSSTPLSK